MKNEIRSCSALWSAAFVFAILFALAQRATAQEVSGASEDHWRPFRPLVGLWKGEAKGFGNLSDVEHRWEFVLQNKFLRLNTRSVVRAKDGDAHEDTGYLSRDTDRNAFVFRDFLSEGFVNTYDVIVDNSGKSLTFEFRDTESAGGMRARMELTFSQEDAYEMVLELAEPGKEFSVCQTMRMKKVTD